MITPKIAQLIEDAHAGRPRPKPRRPKLRLSDLSDTAKIAPEVRDTTREVVRQLAALGPEELVAKVAELASKLNPPTLAAVVDITLDSLRHSKAEQSRAGLASVLVAFGSPANDAVQLALMKAKAGWHQAVFAMVLGEIGLTLPSAEQTGLLIVLTTQGGLTTDAVAFTAIARAIATVRLSLEEVPTRWRRASTCRLAKLCPASKPSESRRPMNQWPPIGILCSPVDPRRHGKTGGQTLFGLLDHP